MALNTSDPEAVRQAAQQILSQPEYTSQRQSTLERVVYYVSHPLELLGLAFQWVATRFFASAGNAIVATILAATIAAVLIFLIVRFSNTATRNSAVKVHYAPTAKGKSVSELLAEADALENEQKFREGIRLRYTAVIQELDAMGIVRARSGRTTGEYLREVTGNAPLTASVFGDATRMFEWVWYGDGEAGPDESSRFKALASATTQKAAA